MNVLPIDLTALVAIFFGCLIVLIPLAGITARFTIKPIAEALARARESQSSNRDLELLEKRLALVEQQLQSVEHSVDQLGEAREFDRKLASPAQ